MIKTPPWWFGPTLLLGALGVWMVARGASNGDGSPTADWVAAIATLGAFLGAVYAGWYVARAYDVELQRERDRAADAKRAQASLVAFWYDVRIPLPGGVVTSSPTLWSQFGVWVRNASELPIFDARLEVFVGEELLGSTPLAGRATGRPDVVPPSVDAVFRGFGEVIGGRLEDLRPAASADGSVSDPPVPLIAFYFTDAAGYEWLRMSDGELRSLGQKLANDLGA